MNVCLSAREETNVFPKVTKKGGAVTRSASHHGQLGVSLSSNSSKDQWFKISKHYLIIRCRMNHIAVMD